MRPETETEGLTAEFAPFTRPRPTTTHADLGVVGTPELLASPATGSARHRRLTRIGDPALYTRNESVGGDLMLITAEAIMRHRGSQQPPRRGSVLEWGVAFERTVAVIWLWSQRAQSAQPISLDSPKAIASVLRPRALGGDVR